MLLLNTILIDLSINKYHSRTGVKGTVSRDFLALFFHQIAPPGPIRGIHWDDFDFFQISTDIFEY